MSDEICPKCGGECSRDEVDVGVGTIHGPWGCSGCGWSSDPRYDHSDGNTPSAQQEHPDWYVDQWGGMIRRSALEERLGRFGIAPEDVRKIFPRPVKDDASDAR
jgi:hypothetical protein